MLLVVAVLGVSPALYSLIYNMDPARVDAVVEMARRREVAAGLACPNGHRQASTAAADCVAPLYRARSH